MDAENDWELGTDIDRLSNAVFIFPFEAWLRDLLMPILEDLLSPTAVRLGGRLDAEEMTRVLLVLYGQRIGVSMGFACLLEMI